jgi:hypothetical protein
MLALLQVDSASLRYATSSEKSDLHRRMQHLKMSLSMDAMHEGCSATTACLSSPSRRAQAAELLEKNPVSVLQSAGLSTSKQRSQTRCGSLAP